MKECRNLSEGSGRPVTDPSLDKVEHRIIGVVADFTVVEDMIRLRQITEGGKHIYLKNNPPFFSEPR